MYKPATQPQPLRFYLRKLKEPFVFKYSPLDSPALSDEHYKWACKKGRFKKGNKAWQHTISTDVYCWMALSFPLAKDVRRYKKTLRFFQMFLAVDDHADVTWGDDEADVKKTVGYLQKVIRVLDTLRDGTPLHTRLLRDVAMLMPLVPAYVRANFKCMQSIMNELSPVQRNRYIDAFKDYLENAAIHAAMKGKEKLITLEQYKAYKVKSCGSIPCTLMMEYLYNFELTEQEYKHPILKRLEELSALSTGLINDLLSFFKEYKGSLHNLNHIIPILMLNAGMNLQEAVDELCNQVELLQDEFVHIRDTWYSCNEVISKNVRLFITGLEYYMAGSARWHRFSKRYHGQHFNAIITTGTLEWSPEGTIYFPDEVIQKTDRQEKNEAPAENLVLE